ncbi:hypothetical protein Salat_2673600 [Sesamum alatum]|uniref:DUF4283 domain-containing protein n=1 Tax=Sesamum alatum TaxID=300844 RepID=A0AAE1XQB2_9LAMI|nr:hypothetical protein Salat_2673600 [Sesamum alatum]
MDSDILKMDKVISLMDEEMANFIIPQEIWDRSFGCLHLSLVGRLVSHRSVHFEAMKGSLVYLIQASRGVSIRKVLESWFCLVFNHVEDLRRVLDMWPWIFYRNLIVLQQLSPQEDPLSLNLDWCPFFVHVHDLPYGLQTIKDHFVDPGTDTLYGAWLQAVGPLRRLGAMMDDIQPTYVPQSHPMSGPSEPIRQGVHIFGDFGSKGNSVGVSISPSGMLRTRGEGVAAAIAGAHEVGLICWFGCEKSIAFVLLCAFGFSTTEKKVFGFAGSQW